MENTISNDYGVVIKKIYSQYHVRVGGRTLPCVYSSHLHRNDPLFQSIAVGDKVRVTASENGSGKIISILPRHNKFSRSAPKPGIHTCEQVIAANMDQIIPVFSTASPIPKWGLLDRCLVAAEVARLPSLICISKSDLAPSDPNFQATFEDFRSIGYQILMVSALTGAGIPELREALRGRVSVLAGKSGVGKTSLLNALQPNLDLPVRPVTRGKRGKGRHTTTHLEMFSLDFESTVVDTPGIRELGLWDIYADELADCFPEMRPFLGSCKFGLDCSHDEEPGCTIRKAVMESAISPRRYRSYMRLREELL